MVHFPGKLTRRIFLQRLAISLTSVAHIPLLQSCANNMPASSVSKLVRVTNGKATDGASSKDNENVNGDVIRDMVNVGIKEFTGKSSIKEAWGVIIPDPQKKVAIKVNCQITGIYTKAKVVNVVTESLIQRGVPPSNIIIYDLTDNAFSYAGFKKNLGNGIKVGTNEDFGGYSLTSWFGSPISKARQRVCKVLAGEGEYGCDYLINIPVQKALDGFAGVSISMKNHFGSISNPSGLHATIQDSIAALNAHEKIASKTRLILMDALYTCYKWVNGRSQEYVEATNQLVFGSDPVAIDYIGWQAIENLRKTHGLAVINPEPTFIKIAAEKYALGNYEKEKIAVVDL